MAKAELRRELKPMAEDLGVSKGYWVRLGR